MDKNTFVSFAWRFVSIVLIFFVTACGSQPNKLDEVRNGKDGPLVHKVEQGGTIPVLVGLSGAWLVDGTLTADEQQKQRDQIAGVQTKLLNEM